MNKFNKLLHLSKNIAASNYGDLKDPYRMTFIVTYQCQLKCNMCNIWQRKIENELSQNPVDLRHVILNYIESLQSFDGNYENFMDKRRIIRNYLAHSVSLGNSNMTKPTTERRKWNQIEKTELRNLKNIQLMEICTRLKLKMPPKKEWNKATLISIIISLQR